MTSPNDLRLELAQQWLGSLPSSTWNPSAYGPPVPASADASFRRYFRLHRLASSPTSLESSSVILMDAPPDKEPLGAFLRVHGLLANAELHVPRCIAANPADGFLLLEDLGTTDLQAVLLPGGEQQLSPSEAWAYYEPALRALVQMQAHGLARPEALLAAEVPPFDDARIRAELSLFPEWYAGRLRGTALTAAEQGHWDRTVEMLLERLGRMPRVLVHRDFHCRNLMVQAGRGSPPGVIDFQDAVQGPATYDLVSLLRDAYIDWPEEVQLDWVIRFWDLARAAHLPVPRDATEFYEDFEWVGLQRHLKVLGIFARLSERDGKHRYLADIPRVMHYTRKVCERYSRLTPLLRILDRVDGIVPQVRTTF